MLHHAVLVSDPAPAGLKLAEDYKILFYDSVDAFLAARQAGKVLAHAAILCTPTHTHVSLAIKLVKAGISTLVEKPLAVTSASGRQLLAAAQGEAKIITGHHRRFHPQTAAVKKLIESGMLGTLVAVSGSAPVQLHELHQFIEGLSPQSGPSTSP